MCIAGDMGRVYEIGPVFRAENSNTHRHLTEYTGLDLEMEIDNHYHEVMNTLDQLFLHIFRGLYNNFRDEVMSFYPIYQASTLIQASADRNGQTAVPA
jgi:aspartyl-tRNA synthetase